MASGWFGARQERAQGKAASAQRLLQWLEGPVAGLRRVLSSLRADKARSRPRQFSRFGETFGKTLLGTATPLRFLGSWQLKLVRRRSPVDGAAGTAADGAQAMPAARHPTLATLQPGPEGAIGSIRPALADLIDTAVIPKLAAAHPPSRAAAPSGDPRVADLAQLLLAKEAAAAFAMIDKIKADADSIASLCTDVFEPAARSMGDLWRRDDCTEFDVTLGLGRLQMALHRCSVETAAAVLPGSAGRTVLLAPSPQESHLLGSIVAQELFWQAGWDVICDFPGSADALNRLVRDRWFDVLELSLSSAFTREHRLEELAATIRAARAHSLNPALTVIVDGRVFHDHPQACAAVGADAGCSCALDLLTIAQRPLQWHSSSMH